MSDSHHLPLDRRAVLAGLMGLGGLALAGCAASGGVPGATTAPSGEGGTSPDSPSPTETPSATATTPSPVSLPSPPPWEPLRGEVEPACKLAAVQAAVSALTVTADGRNATPPPLAPLARMVSGVERSVVHVVYPQYGGLTDDRKLGCVMLVADLISVTPGATEASHVSITADIQLRQDRGKWTVTQVNVPRARDVSAAPTPPVAALLENERVDLPREARADLLTGEIDPRLVTLMTDLSAEFRYGVSVLKAGHPRNVFATGRMSNHTMGQAMDVWSIDGHPVIDQTAAPWQEFIRQCARLGSNSIGGPALLGRRPRFFTDAVHQDHIHVAFSDRKQRRSPHADRNHPSPHASSAGGPVSPASPL